MMDIRSLLLEASEPEFREFSMKLTPGCDSILGVRTPFLKDLAKKIA